jgi:hypothetical protein
VTIGEKKWRGMLASMAQLKKDALRFAEAEKGASDRSRDFHLGQHSGVSLAVAVLDGQLTWTDGKWVKQLRSN